MGSEHARGLVDIYEPQPFFEYWGGRVWPEEEDLDDLCEYGFVSAVV